jgi:hypothetical protein
MVPIPISHSNRGAPVRCWLTFCDTAYVTKGINSTVGIRYVPSKRQLFLDGVRAKDEWGGIGLHRLSGDGFFAPIEMIAAVRLSALRGALVRATQDGAAGDGFSSYVDLPRQASFLLSRAASDEFDSKHSPVDDKWFDLDVDGRLLVCVQIEFTRDDWDDILLEATVLAMLQRSGAEYADAGGYDEGTFVGNPWIWNVRFHPPMTRSTVSSALDLASAMKHLLIIADKGGLDATTSWDLACAGQATALYGQPESNWLEVKVQGWNLSTEAGKIELAQDVARFANGDTAGLLLVGLGTKRPKGVEIVVRGPGLRFTAKDAARHHQILDRRIFPPVDGLRIRPVDDGHGGDLLAFYIPIQSSELKPFLVHGVIVGGKVEGAFFSVVRRRGEHSIPVTAEALHAQIAAGRALLRLGGKADSNGIDPADHSN